MQELRLRRSLSVPGPCLPSRRSPAYGTGLHRATTDAGTGWNGTPLFRIPEMTRNLTNFKALGSALRLRQEVRIDMGTGSVVMPNPRG
jgi:hypothetical protein